jgi:hypothetical protein
VAHGHLTDNVHIRSKPLRKQLYENLGFHSGKIYVTDELKEWVEAPGVNFCRQFLDPVNKDKGDLDI